MAVPKKASTHLKKAASQKSEPIPQTFNQFVWHHKVHEHLKERVRYFLLALSPYNEDKLKESLNNLVRDHDIRGLRAYRVFGRYDLLIRAWMHNDTFVRMVDLFYRYISIDSVRIERIEADYITDVEHRWYEGTSLLPRETTTKQEELMCGLNHELVAQIESGEDGTALKRYEKEDLILKKPGTEKTITFFICVMFPDGSIKTDDRERLLKTIKEYISERKKDYLFAEIDRASGVICNLIIRARALDYFAIGELTAWLSTQPHVSSTETYLSLFELPLIGNTKLSLATFDALDEPNRKVLSIFPDPYYPNGPYPKRKWGVIADDVVTYLLGKHRAYPRGLKTFLHKFLLGVLNRNPAEMGGAIMYIFGSLEGYLRERVGDYIFQRHFKFDTIFEECFPATASPKKQRSRDTLGLAELLHIYYKTIEKTPQELKSPSNWTLWPEVRNWGAHGKGYKWEDAQGDWEDLANKMIRFWDDMESLYREVRKVCKSRDEGLPDVFPDDFPDE
jgi:hypothetical protein